MTFRVNLSSLLSGLSGSKASGLDRNSKAVGYDRTASSQSESGFWFHPFPPANPLRGASVGITSVSLERSKTR